MPDGDNAEEDRLSFLVSIVIVVFVVVVVCCGLSSKENKLT